METPRRQTSLLSLGTLALLGLAALWLYGDVFSHRGPFDRDELVWLRGDRLGSPWRHTQHWLIRDLGVPLFGPSRTGFQALTLAGHVAGAALVAWLVVLLARVGGIGRGVPRAVVGATAIAAALLYLAYDSGAPRWIAALSYELVVVTTLAALGCALRAREGRWRWAWWGGCAACCGLGLMTHVYGVGTPVLVALVDRATPRRGGERVSWPSRVVRYGLLLLPLLLFLVLYRQDLVGQGRAADAGGGAGATIALGLEHLALAVLRVWGGRPDLFRLELAWGGGTALAAGAVLAVAALGIRELVRPREVIGSLSLVSIFLLAFAAVAFVPTLAAPGTLAVGWRFAFCGAGLAAALGGRWLALSATLGGRGVPSPVLAVAPLLAAALLLTLAPQGREAAGHWDRVLRGDARLGDQALWRPGPNCEPGCVDWTGADLTGADLREADLRGASLLWARLDGADLRQADLRGASLDGADLADADLRGAHLDGASLHGAELRRADLRDLDLTGVDLTDADLAEARLEGASLSP